MSEIESHILARRERDRGRCVHPERWLFLADHQAFSERLWTDGSSDWERLMEQWHDGELK